MRKLTTTLLVAFIPLSIFSQCVTSKDIHTLFGKKQKDQEKMVSPWGFKIDKKAIDPEINGWVYKNSKLKKDIVIKFHGHNVAMVKYVLGTDSTCYKILFDASMLDGCIQDYQKTTGSNVYYTYYKNSKYGFETAYWRDNAQKEHFEFNLISLTHFEVLKHHWDNY